MPEFVDPFKGMVPDRKLTHAELVRAIRLNLCAEHEAVHVYMAHADATDHPLAKEVLIDIANEERVHAGEFQRLLAILEADEDRYMADGAAEVNELAGRLGPAGGSTASGEAAGGDASKKPATIGNLKS